MFIDEEGWLITRKSLKKSSLSTPEFKKILDGKLDERILNPAPSIIAKSLAAVDPYQAIMRAVVVRGRTLSIDGQNFDLDAFQRILVVSIGKAAGLMAKAVDDLLGEKISAGIVVDKESPSMPILSYGKYFKIIHSNHPVPGKRSLEAGLAVLDLVKSCSADDLVLFLISGGGSALMVVPPGEIPLQELQAVSQQLLECGAAIDEINTVRKHLDVIKGGGLARAAYPATMVSLVLSDVVGNPLESIASGPTTSDPTRFIDAIDVLKKYNLWNTAPDSIKQILINGELDEFSDTVKPGERCLEKSYYRIIGSNEIAAQAGLNTAISHSFNTSILTNRLTGDAYAAGTLLGGIGRQISTNNYAIQRPACVICGGETTVKVNGDGLGGRNLEVALGAVDALAGLERVALITLATDGEDGPTDAAGAIVTGETRAKMNNIGLDINIYRQRNDSYHFFESLNALIKTGSTGTNVNDLVFLFVY